MSLPDGASWIYNERGNKAGVRLPDGRQISRAEGEKLGARESGYKGPRHERNETARRRDYFDKMTPDKRQGFEQRLSEARRVAKAEGRRFDRRTLERDYWRMHQAGKDARADPAALARLQKAALVVARQTKGSDTSWRFSKGGDTP